MRTRFHVAGAPETVDHYVSQYCSCCREDLMGFYADEVDMDDLGFYPEGAAVCEREVTARRTEWFLSDRLTDDEIPFVSSCG